AIALQLRPRGDVEQLDHPEQRHHPDTPQGGTPGRGAAPGQPSLAGRVVVEATHGVHATGAPPAGCVRTGALNRTSDHSTSDVATLPHMSSDDPRTRDPIR